MEKYKIRDAISNTSDINDAIVWLLNSKEISSTSDILDILESRINKSIRKTIHIGDVVSDTMCFYKEKSFDPTIGIKVVFCNQPGVDADGLTRQFFSSCFNTISDTSIPGYLFEGEITNLSPICRTDTCLSEIFTYIGTIMAHSICHGVRPLRLSNASYHYILSGEFEDALPFLKVNDVATASIKHYLEEVSIFSQDITDDY